MKQPDRLPSTIREAVYGAEGFVGFAAASHLGNKKFVYGFAQEFVLNNGSKFAPSDWGESELISYDTLHEYRVRVGRPKKRWPDVLSLSDRTVVPPIVSSRVVEGLRDAGINTFFAFPVTLDLVEIPKVNYFILFAQPCAQQVWNHTNKGGIFERFYNTDYSKARSNKVDLLSLTSVKNNEKKHLVRSCVCSHRVVELARAKKWTNASFRVLGFPSQIGASSDLRIDYLSREWPPEWRPPLPDELTVDQWVQRAGEDLKSSSQVLRVATLLAIIVRAEELVPRGAELLRSDDMAERLIGVNIVSRARVHARLGHLPSELISEEDSRLVDEGLKMYEYRPDD